MINWIIKIGPISIDIFFNPNNLVIKSGVNFLLSDCVAKKPKRTLFL